jgi:hypothetical protein
MNHGQQKALSNKGMHYMQPFGLEFKSTCILLQLWFNASCIPPQHEDHSGEEENQKNKS